MASEKDLRKKLVSVAKSYVGAKQGDSEHRAIISTFNTVKPDGWAMNTKAPWCAAAASAFAIKAFGKKTAKKYFPLSANCGTIISKAKKMGIWEESDAYKPSPGDWILYDWDDSGKGDNHGGPDHVGTVEKVENGWIRVIEGNKHEKCDVRKLRVNGRYIRGFVLPKYSKMAGSKPKSTKKTTVYVVKKGDTLSEIAREHGTTVAAIAAENGIKNNNLIHVGQKLKITK